MVQTPETKNVLGRAPNRRDTAGKGLGKILDIIYIYIYIYQGGLRAWPTWAQEGPQGPGPQGPGPQGPRGAHKGPAHKGPVGPTREPPGTPQGPPGTSQGPQAHPRGSPEPLQTTKGHSGNRPEPLQAPQLWAQRMPGQLIGRVVGFEAPLTSPGVGLGGVTRSVFRSAASAEGLSIYIYIQIYSRQVFFDNFVKSWKCGWLGGSSKDFHTPKL